MAQNPILQPPSRRTKLDRRRPRPYRLTPEGLASLQRAARQKKPWRWSTGPKTAAGKARASRNALKSGERTAERTAARRELNALLRAMRDQEQHASRCIVNAGQESNWLRRIAAELGDDLG